MTLIDPSMTAPAEVMRLASLVPLVALVAFAAAIDWRCRRIPNWLTFALLAAGMSRAMYLGTLGPALAGAGVGFGLFLPLFVLGALGAGDVKLMTATGVWLGPVGVVVVALAAAVVGLGIILVQCALLGKLPALFRNTGVLLVGLVHVGRVGTAQAAANGRRFTTIDKPLPYAVPVLVALLLALLAGRC